MVEIDSNNREHKPQPASTTVVKLSPDTRCETKHILANLGAVMKVAIDIIVDGFLNRHVQSA